MLTLGVPNGREQIPVKAVTAMASRDSVAALVRGAHAMHDPARVNSADDLLFLTGGASASIGGEVWFDEMPRIYLSGSSGRYPPNRPSHLEAAEQLFSAVGFDVLSLGWDDDLDRPRRVWRGKRRLGEE